MCPLAARGPNGHAMEPQFTIAWNGHYIEVVSVGSKSIDFARQILSEIAKACREHECYRVLGIAYSTDGLSTSDGFDHASLFQELGISNRYKIAWVEANRDLLEPIEFVEKVLYNRGLPGRLFASIEEARNWLVDPA